MKNITVAVDDQTYRMARVKAAESGTSVSALVRDYLRAVSRGESCETGPDRMRRVLDEVRDSMRARGCEFRAADNLPREALHDRDALR